MKKKLNLNAELYVPRGELPDTGLKKPKPRKKNKNKKTKLYEHEIGEILC